MKEVLPSSLGAGERPLKVPLGETSLSLSLEIFRKKLDQCWFCSFRQSTLLRPEAASCEPPIVC